MFWYLQALLIIDLYEIILFMMWILRGNQKPNRCCFYANARYERCSAYSIIILLTSSCNVVKKNIRRDSRALEHNKTCSQEEKKSIFWSQHIKKGRKKKRSKKGFPSRIFGSKLSLVTNLKIENKILVLRLIVWLGLRLNKMLKLMFVFF